VIFAPFCIGSKTYFWQFRQTRFKIDFLDEVIEGVKFEVLAAVTMKNLLESDTVVRYVGI